MIMEDIITIEQRAKDLKDRGMSIRQIAVILNISKSGVSRYINSIGNEGVPKGLESVPKVTSKGNQEVKKSLAEQYITTIELELLKEDIEELVNKRLNHFVTKQLYSLVERYTEHILKAKQELNKEKKSE